MRARQLYLRGSAGITSPQTAGFPQRSITAPTSTDAGMRGSAGNSGARFYRHPRTTSPLLPARSQGDSDPPLLFTPRPEEHSADTRKARKAAAQKHSGHRRRFPQRYPQPTLTSPHRARKATP
ncbi:hypothetical protein KCH_41950 [Kitasatospora cheerisanensis KCTC 2395]|uniref:Uncharacterized protein n=1 Tax=Kitasatospora cheerisanensis KCTC 2395 TaxID=1348663 RepID=A0A066YWQ0_9ACTN|nr:hypothetical protein KCH_41950 [Kitasatospora cheerisanensis KCTC 2395]